MRAFHAVVLLGACCRLRQCLSFALLILMVLSSARAASLNTAVYVDVFCIDKCVVSDQRAISGNNALIEIVVQQVHVLGHIQRIEAALSDKLSNQPVPAKRLALQRLQGMDTRTRERMQHSARGLAKAMQFGIDRAPAIVINSQAVVYGTIDVRAAIAQYQAWQAGGAL